MKKIKVGGVYYSITFEKDQSKVVSSVQKDELLGFTDYRNRNFTVLETRSLDDQRVTFYHELMHGVVEAYHIDRLQDDDGNHNETGIDLMGLALKEALGSVGIDILKFVKNAPNKKRVV